MDEVLPEAAGEPRLPVFVRLREVIEVRRDGLAEHLPVEGDVRVLMLHEHLESRRGVLVVASAEDLQRLWLRIEGEENALLDLLGLGIPLARDDRELAASSS